MEAHEIRERFLSFFEERGHLRVPSASLVPSTYDPSVLLTTAGMQPFKPYFRGEEEPPSSRLSSCQKVFRTVDIDVVGTTQRHLTFFEMLGNFSVGDYFKELAAQYAWELSTEGFGFEPELIWISVFGGDDELGLGPDEEAIESWRAIGVPDERIVRLGKEDNFWQSGPTGPCGPCSELYLDRGLDFGAEGDLPGDDTERFLEYWNLVFMQYELHDDGSLTDLPFKNIDTGMGLDRMAAVLQGVPSVFETAHFRPLVELGEELSGKTYGQDFQTTRAMRILADHGRGATFLLADGVVPSNEERGYVLRRIMRRTIQQGRRLGIEGSFLPRLCDQVIDVMGDAYPDLREESKTIARWAAAEEDGFGRTLEQGERMLAEIITRAKEEGTSWVQAGDAFRLHDTYGFPFEMTKELLAEEGLAVDDQGFEELMERAREVSRAQGRTPRAEAPRAHVRHDDVLRFARSAGFLTHFVGYETTEAESVLRAAERADGWMLAKLEESPFYPEGGGQVSDSGLVETPSGRARVVDVYRLGEDQALALEPLEGELGPGESVHAVVEREARLATMRNHTATHLLHAALRQRLGTHVRQAGSYVGPDKLRFDFTHGERLSDDELADLDSLIGGWIAQNQHVRAIETTRAEAEALGAIALFGEKYGDRVRMVEIEEVSRELCGGTHTGTTAEVGVFHLASETSSASNVRRIEAFTGPAGAELLRERSRHIQEISGLLRVPENEVVHAVERLSRRVKELERGSQAGPDRGAADRLVETAGELAGMRVVVEAVDAPDAKALLELSDAVRQRLGDAAVVLGCAVDGRVHLVANVAPSAVERGVKAGDVVRSAAQVAGGGGGGRDTMAQAGGRDPDKLPDALAAARLEIEKALGAA
ncbi:MAG TPA: alanine--tRNA ligase [Thermoleophilaceae bacterium]|nr:alanine--tRNA ligase [Thermoleophilaceae bacterium]